VITLPTPTVCKLESLGDKASNRFPGITELSGLAFKIDIVAAFGLVYFLRYTLNRYSGFFPPE